MKHMLTNKFKNFVESKQIENLYDNLAATASMLKIDAKM